MSTPDAGADEPREWRGDDDHSAPPTRRPRPVPPARRNQERRARRAARVRTQREDRRRREIERRRRERERRELERRHEAEAAALGSVPEPDAPAWEPPSTDPWQDSPAVSVRADDWTTAPPPEPEPSAAVNAAVHQLGHEPAAPLAPETRPAEPAAPVRRTLSRGGRPGKRRVTVRRVDPWSVFRLSLVLYFCALVVVTLGLVIFWLVLSRLPLLQRTLEVIEQLGIVIDPGLVLTILVPVGLLNVLLWSAANLFFAVLYNLVADLVGGLRLTLNEEP